MSKYTFKPKVEEMNFYQLKIIIILLIEFLIKNQEIDESKIPESIRKHFKKII